MSICPYCQNSIQSFHLEILEAMQNGFGGKKYRCFAYSCPHLDCKKILGVEMDPLGLSTDTAEKTVQRMLRMR